MKIELVTLNYYVFFKEWKLSKKLYSKFNYPAYIQDFLRAFLFRLKLLIRVNFVAQKRSINFLVGSRNQDFSLSKVVDKMSNVEKI